VHSPFVFDFIENVLNDDKNYYCYDKIENERQQLLQNKTVITVEDFGAGSFLIKTNERVVGAIASSSLKPKKFGQLLFRMANYYQSKTIIELGTSFGISTSYLANGNTKSTIHTCEGAINIASIAKQTFTNLQLQNIVMNIGDFEKTLTPLLQQLQKIDFAFVDGNHKKEPTLHYFHQLLQHSTNKTILIFDDIHWSTEMEDAWGVIKNHPSVTLTIDLFFIGLVFINADFKEKQHFTIRF
jgi:predicted O-methyltransferase YrrM